MYIQTLLVVSVLYLVNGQDRKIEPQLNPGCLNCTNTTLVYIRADGAHDTVHQLWDFTRGIPTVIFTITNLTTMLNVTWHGMEPRDITLSETPKYSFAIAFDKLYEYNDTKDIGHIDSRYPQKSYPLKHLTWRLHSSRLSDKEAMVKMHSDLRDSYWHRRGIIEMKLDLLPFKDYAVELPHLIHTANSTLIDLCLVNLTTSREYNASRYAARALLASTDRSADTMHYSMRKSLDDEHTPGVFEIIEIKTPSSFLGGDGGFVQFRPVAYVQPARAVDSSTNVRVSDFNRTSIPNRSTLQMFYKNLVDEDHLLIQDVFISFGETGDGYYKQHNYTAWSFTVGYGSPPVEGFSFFVIMIISIGLGVPVVLALSGVTYVLVRRYKQRNAPTRFTDDA